MTNNNLTDELMQEIYEEAVSAECFERASVDAACFDLLCKADEAGGLSRTVRVLIDMVRAGRAELQEYRKAPAAINLSDECRLDRLAAFREYDITLNGGMVADLIEEVQGGRKAAAEPVAWLWIGTNGDREASAVCPDDDEDAVDAMACGWSVQPLYTAHQPAPIAPEEMTPDLAWREYGVAGEYCEPWSKGWNACRAAFQLFGNSEHVSQPYKLPENSFTNEDLEGMICGNNPQSNAYRELLSLRQAAEFPPGNSSVTVLTHWMTLQAVPQQEGK